MLIYFLISLAPGDPVDILVPPETRVLMAPGWRDQLRQNLGLDKPLPVRYVLWLKELSQGNLGYSFTDGRPVTRRVAERFEPTLRLMGTALLLSLLIGIPAGVLMALKQYSLFDYALTLATFTSLSIPSFFFGLILIYIFALRLNLLPTAGMTTVGAAPSLWDSLAHMVLPASMLALREAGIFARYTRASVLDVLHSEYVTTARSKGLPEALVIWRHVFRNALLPLITIVGLELPMLLGGSVIVEQVFQWPGMGMLGVQATLERDYPVIMGVVIIAAAMVLLSNLLADLAYAVADPRIRYD
ncbi:MAG: ABC transporter permease [Chloroflexi bacterium]|nr:ABC transporter permease [Chloroflexota bacterium]